MSKECRDTNMEMMVLQDTSLVSTITHQSCTIIAILSLMGQYTMSSLSSLLCTLDDRNINISTMLM